MLLKSLPEHLRPRERLLSSGSQSLSDAELVAIIFGKGTRDKGVVDLSAELLAKYSLQDLSQIRVQTLMREKGIGLAKACQLVACFEMGKRVDMSTSKKQVVVESVEDIVFLFSHIRHLKKEHCYGVYLDVRKRVIKIELLTVGTIDSTIISSRCVFEPALSLGAAGVVLVHNHPSGESNPSEADVKVTEQLVESGKILEIQFVDHIIIGREGYWNYFNKC
jgi:DNA repair protein RadC